MTDKCGLRGCVRTDDWPHLKQILDITDDYREPFEDTDNSIAFTAEDADAAWHGLFDLAAMEGLVFIVQHGAGGGYGKGAMYSTGDQKLHNVDTDCDDIIAVSFTYGSPTVSPVLLEQAVAAWHAEQTCLKILNQEED